MHTTSTAPATTTGRECGCGDGSTCHSLQCLCRPRFFAGQLVTDADFRRLDDYIVGKSRLHNRHVHGTGVACGLEVACSPCDDTVTVRPGYALGPCGEDIVVCADTRIDVAGLIRAERRTRARDCGPFRDPPVDCEAAQQRWVLNICYDEQPARAVTTLTPSRTSCDCGAGGGGPGGGGCGCAGSSGGAAGGSTINATASCGCRSATPATPARRGACEPTVICEGFRFTLTKVPPEVVKPRVPTPTGALAARVKDCLTAIVQRISRVPTDPTPADLVQYCCQLKADLREIIETAAVQNCRLGQRLSVVVCPDPSDREAADKAQQAITGMLAIAVDLYRECVCSALLPPCPDDSLNDCVPLATLTVRSSDLQVLDICNWTSRRFAVTLPMLGYWLGWLPFATVVSQTISRLCCLREEPTRFDLDNGLKVSEHSRAGSESTADGPTAAEEQSTALRVAAQYAEHTSPLSGVEATLLQSLGATGPQDAVLASDAELADPLAAFALARLLGPAAASLGSPLQAPAEAVVHRAAAADVQRIDTLEKAVADLRKTVNAQARTITSLRKGQQK